MGQLLITVAQRHRPTGAGVNGQQGNALFLILIAVILFAALSYAITQSNRSGGNPSQEAAATAAASVFDYANAISTAYHMMKIRGADMSLFEAIRPTDNTFNDPPQAVKLFHPNGGGVSYRAPWPDAFDMDASPDITVDSALTSSFSSPELEAIYSADSYIGFITFSGLKKNICQAINEKILGPGNAIPNWTGVTVAEFVQFTMTIPQANGNAMNSLCFSVESPPGTFTYYYIKFMA